MWLNAEGSTQALERPGEGKTKLVDHFPTNVLNTVPSINRAPNHNETIFRVSWKCLILSGGFHPLFESQAIKSHYEVVPEGYL